MEIPKPTLRRIRYRVIDRFAPDLACYSAKELGKTVVTKVECRVIEGLEDDEASQCNPYGAMP
jgi:hypothetical protein